MLLQVLDLERSYVEICWDDFWRNQNSDTLARIICDPFGYRDGWISSVAGRLFGANQFWKKIKLFKCVSLLFHNSSITCHFPFICQLSITIFLYTTWLVAVQKRALMTVLQLDYITIHTVTEESK